MKQFEKYLYNKGFSDSTAEQYIRHTNYFKDWLKKESTTPRKANHNDIINFLSYAEKDNKSLNHRSKLLVGIRHYFDYLSNNKKYHNPAKNLYLKGMPRNIFNNFIDFNRLETIYGNYSNHTIRQKRNRVILGLLIFQGITTEELHLLQAPLIDFNKGSITIPSGKRTNSRILHLDARQIISLNEYLNQTRKTIILQNNIETPQLIISSEGNNNLKPTLHHLFRELKKSYPDIQNAKQIRLSVIQHWLKSNNLRKVQYMAGHKHVSSTEKYLFNDLDDLQNDIEKLHPIQ